MLDTNVLMHDPTSLFRFEEHDIYMPIRTLEELDDNKKGITEVARNARQASRFLDELVTAMPTASAMACRSPSGRRRHRQAVSADRSDHDAAAGVLASGKADNQIFGVAMHLQHRIPSAT